jgi:hypothetical protein
VLAGRRSRPARPSPTPNTNHVSHGMRTDAQWRAVPSRQRPGSISSVRYGEGDGSGHRGSIGGSSGVIGGQAAPPPGKGAWWWVLGPAGTRGKAVRIWSCPGSEGTAMAMRICLDGCPRVGSCQAKMLPRGATSEELSQPGRGSSPVGCLDHSARSPRSLARGTHQQQQAGQWAHCGGSAM